MKQETTPKGLTTKAGGLISGPAFLFWFSCMLLKDEVLDKVKPLSLISVCE